MNKSPTDWAMFPLPKWPKEWPKYMGGDPNNHLRVSNYKPAHPPSKAYKPPAGWLDHVGSKFLGNTRAPKNPEMSGYLNIAPFQDPPSKAYKPPRSWVGKTPRAGWFDLFWVAGPTASPCGQQGRLSCCQGRGFLLSFANRRGVGWDGVSKQENIDVSSSKLTYQVGYMS